MILVNYSSRIQFCCLCSEANKMTTRSKIRQGANGMNGLIQQGSGRSPDNGTKPIYSLNTNSVGGRQIRKVSDTEYQREVNIGKAPDTFPCGHVLCHKCIRNHMTPSKEEKLSCPLCGQEASRIFTADPGTSLGYNTEDVDNITLLSNFDDIVKRFNGLKYSVRSLHRESVQSRSLGLSFTNCACHLCQENHGTLQVLQEFNQLQFEHVKPVLPAPYYYRLAQGEIVTSFYSVVNSCCICVPCTYSELRESEHFPQLKNLSDNEATHNPKAVLAEVGKIIAKNTAPLQSLHGKNVIEIDHKIKLQIRADEFDFDESVAKVKQMVNEQEQNMIKSASYYIQDTGGVRHLKGSNSYEQNLNETVVW